MKDDVRKLMDEFMQEISARSMPNFDIEEALFGLTEAQTKEYSSATRCLQNQVLYDVMRSAHDKWHDNEYLSERRHLVLAKEMLTLMIKSCDRSVS